MRKLVISVVSLFLLLIFPKTAGAASYTYRVNDYQSQITIEQDTSLTVTETIEVDFGVPKHGIFRIIPVTYSARGKTIKAKFNLESVTDEFGTAYKYTTSRVGQSVRIKIGDPDKTITGGHTYVINYSVDKVLLRYPDHDELYWNVTGSEWDTEIEAATANVISAHAKITKIECFAGEFESREQNCQSEFSSGQAQFSSTKTLGPGRDFSIVVGLNKDNQLAFPGFLEKSVDAIFDNWGYPVALAPFLIIVYFWYKKGRDRRYLTENIYYKPEDTKTKKVSPFARKHLPLVYSPIQGITPSQVGTIIDERVDIADIVSEIVELARLGYLKIKKIEKKGIIRKRTDYSFTKIDKDKVNLKEYQKYLLEKLFEKTTLKDNYVLLSDLKNKFYKSLNEFKKKLYKNLAEEAIFSSNPEKVRTKWIAAFIVLFLLSDFGVFVFAFSTNNFGPLVISILTIIPGILLARSMPRRTAWGYSLFRQIGGLRWYLRKGKWRHEIAEKHLFIEEILPLAISLGVVTQLAKHMQDLDIRPPAYFVGATVASFPSDIKSFKTSAASSLLSSPGGKWSGASSWSGGSGFSGGGFSGGGFGGGGGGSW